MGLERWYHYSRIFPLSDQMESRDIHFDRENLLPFLLMIQPGTILIVAQRGCTCALRRPLESRRESMDRYIVEAIDITVPFDNFELHCAYTFLPTTLISYFSYLLATAIRVGTLPKNSMFLSSNSKQSSDRESAPFRCCHSL